MHYYKRNLGDYAKKTGRLTMLQHGAYTLLIDSCYDREAFPTLEQALEWTWASTEAEAEAVKFVLNRFFKLNENGEYVQDRILSELIQYHEKADKNKTIAIERETNRRLKSTKRAPDVHEPPPNQEPLTKNQEPVTSNQQETLTTLSGKPDVDLPKSKSENVERLEIARTVIDFLNTKTGRNYRHVPANLEPICARLKEGATLTELRQVIAKKTREWGTDEKMNQFLRPDTLFNRTKFAQYQGELV